MAEEEPFFCSVGDGGNCIIEGLHTRDASSISNQQHPFFFKTKTPQKFRRHISQLGEKCSRLSILPPAVLALLRSITVRSWLMAAILDVKILLERSEKNGVFLQHRPRRKWYRMCSCEMQGGINHNCKIHRVQDASVSWGWEMLWFAWYSRQQFLTLLLIILLCGHAGQCEMLMLTCYMRGEMAGRKWRLLQHSMLMVFMRAIPASSRNAVFVEKLGVSNQQHHVYILEKSNSNDTCLPQLLLWEMLMFVSYDNTGQRYFHYCCMNDHDGDV